MMKNVGTIVAASFLAVVLLLYMCTFQVRYTEVAIVKTFGKPAQDAKTKAGLYFKWPPPIQTYVVYDKRIRVLEDRTEETRTVDGKNLIVTTFATWQIGGTAADAVKFLKNFPGGIEDGKKKLRTTIITEKHAVIGKRSFDEFVSTEPGQRHIREIEKEIRDTVAATVRDQYGIVVQDFGIKKLSLPKSVTSSIFETMKAKENEKAARYQAEGAARAQDIEANARATEQRILAAAREKVADIQNEANRVVSDYYKQFDEHPELRIFLDTLRTLEAALSERTTIILDSSQSPWDLFDSEVRAKIRPDADQRGDASDRDEAARHVARPPAATGSAQPAGGVEKRTMHQDHDAHVHHDSDVVEPPLDAATQSLADALRSSFGILKGIMTILVVLYLFSNIDSLDTHEQALVLRLGKIHGGVRGAGLVWALPFPIDEIVRLPSQQSNLLDPPVTSHTFRRRPGEIGKPLSFVSRGHGGLDPVHDGALLTADTGLVHMQWNVTYKIDDVVTYVTHLAGSQTEAADKLIRTLVETCGIAIASELTAEELIRTRVDYVQSEMRRRINQRLDDMHSGIVVATVEMFEPTPPINVRSAFDGTQQAENAKEKRIRRAEQEATKTLSEAAGATYQRLVDALDRRDLADTPETRKAVEHILMNVVEGRTGELLKQAGAYSSVVIGGMKSDLDEYRTLVPEYERNAGLLVQRLWEQTRRRIFDRPGVAKIYKPAGAPLEVRIPIDPEQSRASEERRLQRKPAFNADKYKDRRLHPVGPNQE